eukprot:SAG31_NODE_490_length_14932_cov_9.350300_16_plen_65_part_00
MPACGGVLADVQFAFGLNPSAPRLSQHRGCPWCGPYRATLSRLVPYFSRLKSRISRIVAQKPRR